jgi:sensor histidine kinase regulating citrate/malate metabolism
MSVGIWIVAGLGIAAAVIGIIFTVRASLYRFVDRRITAYQKDLLVKHYDEVQNIYREMRGWRHDYHNHIQTMKAYRKLNENTKLDEYLDDLDADLTNVDTLIKSGNVMVDAILNSKLSLARSREININAKAAVPAELSISEIDLCIILGNLLDNAMEACLKLINEEDRHMRVYIDIKRDQLYISVTNTSGGNANKQNGRYLSGKAGNHGLGLMRVDRLVDKYGGYIKRRDEEGAFSTEILLPI